MPGRIAMESWKPETLLLWVTDPAATRESAPGVVRIIPVLALRLRLVFVKATLANLTWVFLFVRTSTGHR